MGQHGIPHESAKGAPTRLVLLATSSDLLMPHVTTRGGKRDSFTRPKNAQVCRRGQGAKRRRPATTATEDGGRRPATIPQEEEPSPRRREQRLGHRPRRDSPLEGGRRGHCCRPPPRCWLSRARSSSSRRFRSDGAPTSAHPSPNTHTHTHEMKQGLWRITKMNVTKNHVRVCRNLGHSFGVSCFYFQRRD